MEVLLPIVILSGGALSAYVVGRLSRSRMLTGLVAFLAVVGAGHAVYQVWGILGQDMTVGWPGSRAVHPFESYLTGNHLGVFLATTTLMLSALVAIYSMRYMHRRNIGKFYALLLIMTAGIVGIGFAGDLFTLYVVFEVMSVASYVLVAFERDEWEPVEAGVKYLVISTTGSLLALLAIAIIFTYSGSLDLVKIPGLLAERLDTSPMMALTAMILAGFGVKAAIVPMHTWLPDAHSAAPSGISAMLSGIVIEAGLIAMVKVLIAISAIQTGMLLVILALLTMFVGNLVALRQNDLKRMFAYSSVAQMGYIFMGVGLALGFPTLAAYSGMRGALYHILNHAIMKGGAFLCAGAFLFLLGTRDMRKLSGIGRRFPVVAVCLLIFALALAGTPPFNGFFSKLLLVRAGADVGGWGIFMAAMLVLNSVISLFYYLGAVNTVVFGPEPDERRTVSPLPFLIALPIVVLAAASVLLGVYPQIGLELVDPAAEQLVAMIAGL
ncbi:MAG: proton-conducting transporter membrane subunit [Armatimonadota bacterium]|nr:proton-conducting transporter membrane subunit [Armatimonadota bacterium]